MPREQINYPITPTIIFHGGYELEMEPGGPAPDNGEIYAEPALHVNWTAAGDDHSPQHVQLSLTMEAGYLKARAGGLDDSVVQTAIFTPSLSRYELNKLIRVLRTARDKAYGRDE